LKDSQTDLSITNSSRLEMQQKYEELKEKIDSVLKDGIEWKDIEESLTIVNLRKRKGISEENLLNVENSLENKKLLQDLQVQYADCVRDLDKYQKLLEIEEKINNEYKLENEDLKKKIEQIKNEYGIIFVFDKYGFMWTKILYISNNLEKQKFNYFFLFLF